MKSIIFLIAVLATSCSNDDTKVPLTLKTGNPSGDQKPKVVATAVESKSAFEANLLPILNSNCSSCHSPDGFGTAPASVYQVAAMEALAKKGTSATDNDLIKKLLNQVTHGGGNVCPKGTGEFPCAPFVDWARGLYSSAIPTIKPGTLPKDSIVPPTTATDNGFFRSFDFTGQVDGFAYDRSNPALQVPVEFYTALYTPGATPFASATANSVGSSGGVAGNHRFSLNIAANLPTASASVTLYAYAVIGGSRKAIGESPKTVTVYKKNPAGKAFFEATLRPILVANCERCHGSIGIHESTYLNLLNPTPGNGGTATNNLVYRKASGGGHSGGNVCGTNAQICPNIINWFNAEFP
jgi:cytochrome c553